MAADSSPRADKPDQYVVVARRYRPQTFEELVGQQHVARALTNAIGTHRVGHAYLFTGARGVGKTSTARILARALNCIRGPTATPCNECDICRSVSSGDDVDVLEIDGASNRGIDEIRQLRQNVGVRPSRARFKIYIIDEVHMLTKEAFNALLKTLEEPPEHVKFIFCTTEATKIPITILSRCQRFDFAGILPDSIAERLRQIVDAEGVAAEPEALEVLARRANGSMRDSQSLFEQLLAFAPERITVTDVHGMLGSAGEERLARIVGALVAHDAAAALTELDAAVQEGVDVGQLVEQLFGYLRDAMVVAVGCKADALLYAFASSFPLVEDAARQMGLETLLAAMQILDQTLARLRYSTQARVLAELALVRICQLENLEAIAALVAELSGEGRPAAVSAPRAAPGRTAATEPPGAKKKVEPTLARPESDAGPPGAAAAADGPRLALVPENAARIWTAALARVTGLAAEQAKHFERVAIHAPNRVEVCFKGAYNFAKAICERPEQLARFEQAMAEVTGQEVRVSFTACEDETSRPAAAPLRAVPVQQRLMEAAQQPIIQRAGELFGANAVRVDDPPGGAKPADQES